MCIRDRQHPARQAAIKADIPEEIPALTVNKMCGSSMKAIMLAANAIRAGESEILIAGGMAVSYTHLTLPTKA